VVHVVEFQPVKDALFENVDARMRQVALKVLMARAASQIAKEREILALVTGDALGQVSSQTLPHLIGVSEAADVPILRPLLGLPKDAIIDYARRIGTAEISARAREVCDLSEGRPVATSARPNQVGRSVGDVPQALMEDAVATRKTFQLKDWFPGAM
jgi:thiamine biosynthesis protein ThiI